MHPALAAFSAPTSAWFASTFAEPTQCQVSGWQNISAGHHCLIAAPTGSGKTLAAFLWAIDRVMSAPEPPRAERTRVLYLSPLRALAVDVDKNLRAPLAGISLAAERLGVEVHLPIVGVRTGDTSAAERRRLVSHPPDIAITTPESLYLMLTSKARETLRWVRWVIVDEIHSVAATKRGTHLALSLERLSELTALPDGQLPQRIGLSATQRPLSEVARFLGGSDSGRPRSRHVQITDVGMTKQLDVEVIVGVSDMGDLAASETAGETHSHSIWPAVHPRLLELIYAHRSTIIFTNARRLAERLATRLNELHLDGLNRAAEADGTSPPEVAGLAAIDGQDRAELVRAHHGSLSREQRLSIEDDLKAGRVRAIVATSSLELGIDMGAVDLVIHVASPPSVAAGMQRIGRAGHQVGEPSVGKIFPRHRGDLVEAAVVAQRMGSGEIEAIRYPRQPLDVLAQQIVAMVAVDDWSVEGLLRVVRRAAPYEQLSEEVLLSVLDLLAGRYPSEEFRELRPRIVWDRTTGMLRARQGAGRLAVTNAGTIPDRGLYAVFTTDGSRVGELDEEMVYEARVGETFLLGASTWRIAEITFDRVIVTPAPGEPGKMPFWHGDGPGRPLELGRAVGAFVRDVVNELPEELPDELLGKQPNGHSQLPLLERLQRDNCLDRTAAVNVLRYFAAQRSATGVVPDDRTIVVERFRDEIGDWRICILTPFGARVHAPWGIALGAKFAGLDQTGPELLWSDDGIVLRLPDTGFADTGFAATGPDYQASNGPALDATDLALDPDEVRDAIVGHLPSTALFASRFREVAGRALLLPRRRPGERVPLWQQRQRSAGLLEVAAKYPSFPMLLETSRECLQEVFDVPALAEVLSDIRSRKIRMVTVDTDGASPMAQSLLFDWIAVFMYGGDAPLAERRAAALSLDSDLLADLLGADELRELLDAEVLAQLELELQRLADGRRARNADELADVLTRVGDLTEAELSHRCERQSGQQEIGQQQAGQQQGFQQRDSQQRDSQQQSPWLAELLAERRAVELRVAGESRYVAVEDAARYRDALGCALPAGLPAALTTDTLPTGTDPLDELVARYASTHVPFKADAVAKRFGIPVVRVTAALNRLETARRVTRGAFQPGAVSAGESEWCDTSVLRTVRRRSLARLRREVEPVPPEAYARFVAAWHNIDRPRRGGDALADAITQLAGAPVAASILETDVLPARVARYSGADLDALLASGELVWVGAGSLGPSDGRVCLYWRDELATLAPAGLGNRAGGYPDQNQDPVAAAVLSHLAERGATFWPDLLGHLGAASVAAKFTDSANLPNLNQPNLNQPNLHQPSLNERVLTALWDLVWAGYVTNDTFAPLRALSSARSGRRKRGTRGPSPRSRTRPRPGRLRASGPPGAAGRWSLVLPLRETEPTEKNATTASTQRAYAAAQAMLERHGVVTRPGVLADGHPGGFAAVYGVLRALEERGSVRRGHFVEGLGAAQFASAAAVERLRDHRETVRDGTAGEVSLLASADPAQPYGAALSWPPSTGRPSRVVGGHVVLADGRPLAMLDRGGRSMHTFETTVEDLRWIGALRDGLACGRLARVELARIDAMAAADHPIHDTLIANGFSPGYRGPTLAS